MSIRWYFQSIDWSKWSALLEGKGGGKDVFTSATWDEDSYESPDLRKRLATSIANSGISYDGLTPTEAAELDSVIHSFFCPEGVESYLSIEYESPDGLHRKFVQDLVTPSRPAGTQSLIKRLFAKTPQKLSSGAEELILLPLLLSGRRISSTAPPDEDYLYIVFSPEELALLCDEAERCLASGRPWPEKWFEAMVTEYLIDVIKTTQAKGKGLACVHA